MRTIGILIALIQKSLYNDFIRPEDNMQIKVGEYWVSRKELKDLIKKLQSLEKIFKYL